MSGDLTINIAPLSLSFPTRRYMRTFLYLCLLFKNGLADTIVSSIRDLTASIANATEGTTIVVQNGSYNATSTIEVGCAGTAENGIVIRAETVGGVELGGSNGFIINDKAAFVTIQGFNFTHTAAIEINGAHHCRLTDNVIQLAIPHNTSSSYIIVSADYVEIDRNELRNKSTLGQMINVKGSSGSQVARYLWIHHNYFHDFSSPGGNGAETIRLGLSGLSPSAGNAIVEYNLFVRCRGENELISNNRATTLTDTIPFSIQMVLN